MTTTSRHDSTELAHVWQPRPPRFDAKRRAPARRVRRRAGAGERWDAPLVRLPDRDAVRDYLIAPFVALERRR
jgi:hypothetical protein